MGLIPKMIKRSRSDLILPSYLNQSLNDIEIKFDRLNEEEHARFGKPEWSVNHGLSPTSLPRNRYRGVVPWDKTRVKLPVEGNANDYINASWVTLTPGGALAPPSSSEPKKEKEKDRPVAKSRTSRASRLFISHSRSNSSSSSERQQVAVKDIKMTATPTGSESEQVDTTSSSTLPHLPDHTSSSSSSTSLSNQHSGTPLSASSSDMVISSSSSSASKTYIVTQGPLNSTVGHFWQMVNASCGNPAVIVMLTALSEPYRGQRMNKCARYWPVDKQIPLSIPREQGFKDELSIRLVSLTQFSYYELRELEIINITTGTTKTVHHFYYNTWPDFDNPSGGADMVNFVSTVNAKNTTPESPLVVHCSAGIGRSGTYLAIDAALTRGCWINDDRDLVYDLVSSMRQQRLGMVQKATQLEYIYHQVKFYLKGIDH